MSRDEKKAERAERRARNKAAGMAKLEELKREMDDDFARSNGADPETVGRTVESERFGGKTITIYANGYVQVAGLFSSPPPEKLVQIVADVQVTMKTGIGRGAAAVVTGGWSLATTPNKRGDIFLTILTEQQTHKLHTNVPTDEDIKKVKTLEVAGQAVLGSSSRGEASNSAPQAVEKSIPDQIREMKALLDEGLVTEEDFEQFKKRLIG